MSTLKENQLTDEDIKFLFNTLRKSSVIWSGRKEILRLSRQRVLVRRTKTGEPVYKYQWRCAVCNSWKLSEKEMEVDHISEIGGVSEFKGDWNETIGKIFPRPVEKYLQVCCISCHARKTAKFNSARTRYQRKK